MRWIAMIRIVFVLAIVFLGYFAFWQLAVVAALLGVGGYVWWRSHHSPPRWPDT
jgi:hypothetical protein